MSMNSLDKGLKDTTKDLERAFGASEKKEVPTLVVGEQKKIERKQSTTFTIKPSNIQKLKEASEKHGFSSASAFLDDLIEKNF